MNNKEYVEKIQIAIKDNFKIGVRDTKEYNLKNPDKLVDVLADPIDNTIDFIFQLVQQTSCSNYDLVRKATKTAIDDIIDIIRQEIAGGNLGLLNDIVINKEATNLNAMTINYEILSTVDFNAIRKAWNNDVAQLFN